VISEMFAFFMASPKELPASYQEKTRQEPLYRVVCDYIAGSTDLFILDQHQRFCPLKRQVRV
jgi:dGTPase